MQRSDDPTRSHARAITRAPDGFGGHRSAHRCPTNSFSSSNASSSCATCASITTGGFTNGQTGQISCTCSTGGNTTVAGGYYSNGLTAESLACNGKPCAHVCALVPLALSCTPTLTTRRLCLIAHGPACPAYSYQPSPLSNNTACVCIVDAYSAANGGTASTAPCSGVCPAPSPLLGSHCSSLCPRSGLTHTACQDGSGTYGQTGSATCTCRTGGSTTSPGGYFGNGLVGDSVACFGTPHRLIRAWASPCRTGLDLEPNARLTGGHATRHTQPARPGATSRHRAQ